MILAAQIGTLFAYIGGTVFVVAGLYRTIRRRLLDPLLLVCISAISFSWLEAPYDWAMYAQFPPFMPRMPSWWPFNMTWGGLPAAVPPGYIAYFVPRKSDSQTAAQQRERPAPSQTSRPE